MSDFIWLVPEWRLKRGAGAARDAHLGIGARCRLPGGSVPGTVAEGRSEGTGRIDQRDRWIGTARLVQMDWDNSTGTSFTPCTP
jgi:hypothetical protein